MGLAEIAVVLIVMRPANIQGWAMREEHVFHGNPDKAWITCMVRKELLNLPPNSVAYCTREAKL